MGPTSIMGKAVQSEIDGPGSFVVDFFQEPDPKEESNYNVVDTDYRTYALVYNCSESSTWWGWTYTSESFNLLARGNELSDELLTSLEAKMKYLIPYFDYDYYVVPTLHDESCNYEPEPPVEGAGDEDEDDLDQD